MLVDDPETAHALLVHLTGEVTAFALAQVAAGADMIGAGDAAASLLSPAMYREFALPYEQQVCAAVHAAKSTVKLHVPPLEVTGKRRPSQMTAARSTPCHLTSSVTWLD
jgi:uroporphyrinogen-III decarboxylase